MNKGYKAILLAAQRSNENRNENRNEMRNENRGEMRNENRGEMRNEIRGRYEGEYRGGNEQMEMAGYESRRGRGNNMQMGGYGMNYPQGEYRNEYRMEEPRQEYRGEYRMEAPEQDDQPESAFRDRRGRRHYDNGRFAPMRNEIDSGRNPQSAYQDPGMRRLPPVYEQPEQRRYEPNNALPQMGFDGNAEAYHADIWRSKPGMTQHQQMTAQYEELTEEKAKHWLEQMQNEDGTRGPHWTLDQVKQVAKQKAPEEDPIKLWVAMNMIRSDYYPVAKKFNVNSTDFYLEMAKAFLEDKDAAPEKLKKYFEYVVK